MRSAAGEIVEVQGGHILPSVSRKDRHCKVCTAKGPRDRRVRLAANTAIQFYDVQDRLGFDRPSKAVDWLIQNAKAAIDELGELPTWHPSSAADNSGKETMAQPEPDTPVDFSFHGSSDGDRAGSCILPPSIESNTIAETTTDRGAYFWPEFFSNKTHRPQDLRLSLQSIQDNTFNHSNPMQYHPLHFDSASASFAEQNQRIASWNLEACGDRDTATDFSFNMAPVLFRQGHLSTQREPLQSSNTSFLRPWMNPNDQQIHQPLIPAISSVGFALRGRGFSGFHIPAQIQGEEVLEGIFDKPSSVSSASYHQ